MVPDSVFRLDLILIVQYFLIELVLFKPLGTNWATADQRLKVPTSQVAG